MRIRFEECPPALKERIIDAIRKQDAGDRVAVSSGNMEPPSRNAPLGEEKVARLRPPVSIHLHSYRKRLCDADGASGKAVIDGLVLAGVIPNDDPANVKEVTFSQEKGKEEKTIVTIKEIKCES